MTEKVKKKFYQANWFMWVTLIVFAPVGIFVMWKYNKLKEPARWALTVVFGLFFGFMVIGSNISSKSAGENNAVSTAAPKTSQVSSGSQVQIENSDKAKEEAEAKAKAEADAKAKAEAEAKAKEEAKAKADDYFNKGEDLMQKTDFKGAIENYNKAIALNPSIAKYYYRKFIAVSLVDSKNYTEQVQCLNKAIELEPNNGGYYIDKAYLQDSFAKYDEALVSVDKGIELNQSNAFGYRTKAAILKDLGRYDEALDVSDTAIQIEPKNELGYMTKGKILQGLKRYQEELDCYKEMAEKIPGKQQFYDVMVKSYHAAGIIQ